MLRSKDSSGSRISSLSEQSCANTIVAQMLPDGSVKGGSAIKMRLGDGATRFTTDLDIARASAIDDFFRAARRLFGNRMGGLHGRVGRVEAGASQRRSPAICDAAFLGEAIIQRQTVGNHRPRSRPQLEIGDADKPDFVSPEDANAVLEKPGFSAARPDSHHGAAPPNRPEAARCERAQQHAGSRPHRFAAARQGLRRRLLRRASNLHEAFAYRKMHSWPPTIAGGQEWATIYADQLPDGNLIPEVDDAIAWANSLINWDRYRPIAQHLHQKTRARGHADARHGKTPRCCRQHARQKHVWQGCFPATRCKSYFVCSRNPVSAILNPRPIFSSRNRTRVVTASSVTRVQTEADARASRFAISLRSIDRPLNQPPSDCGAKPLGRAGSHSTMPWFRNGLESGASALTMRNFASPSAVFHTMVRRRTPGSTGR